MLKLCLNSRDEMYILDLEKVAYMAANGNYTRIVYIEGMQVMATMGISKMEEMIKKVIPVDRKSPFVRLGRSLMINQNYLSHINILKQRITLSDNQTHSHMLEVPKALLRAYKDLIINNFSNQ